ncbi:hypothetical protein NL676_032379 [Syzygium grande]|nr:hypothetical protein NL676_032379 [Syzygium grande]
MSSHLQTQIPSPPAAASSFVLEPRDPALRSIHRSPPWVRSSDTAVFFLRPRRRRPLRRPRISFADRFDPEIPDTRRGLLASGEDVNSCKEKTDEGF